MATLFDDDPPPKTVWQLHQEECARTAQLFPPAVASSPTSVAAAESLSTAVLARQEQAVFDAVRDSPHGLTCDAIEAQLGLRHQSASARVWGLRRQQRLLDSGRTAPTRSGRQAVVWVCASRESA